ncbi:hypothetical protein TPA0910_11760 [Streptomyces hygroscopicus subsp. sporocinereus]|uniref:Uncharacterized protein n=1 Tax=Streptomyces hygroscopicus TaxID=1912 RepID=A0ABQ3TTZ6_STRHY|nr:hypothetical protein TPA0910_11760 [Streptomyces hygroscopicus]
MSVHPCAGHGAGYEGDPRHRVRRYRRQAEGDERGQRHKRSSAPYGVQDSGGDPRQQDKRHLPHTPSIACDGRVHNAESAHPA